MRTTVRGNIFAIFLAFVFMLLGILGLINNFRGIWIVMFGALIAACLLFIFCSLRIRIMCGEEDFVYRGAFSKNARYAYHDIDKVVFSPLSFTLIFTDGKKIRIPSMCVHGLRTFINVGKIEKVIYK